MFKDIEESRESALEKEIITLNAECIISDRELESLGTHQQNKEKKKSRYMALIAVGLGCILTPNVVLSFFGQGPSVTHPLIPWADSLSDILVSVYLGAYAPFATLGVIFTKRSYKKKQKKIEIAETKNKELKEKRKIKESELNFLRHSKVEEKEPIIENEEPTDIKGLFKKYLIMKNKILSLAKKYQEYAQNGTLVEQMARENLSSEDQEFVQTLLKKQR